MSRKNVAEHVAVCLRTPLEKLPGFQGYLSVQIWSFRLQCSKRLSSFLILQCSFLLGNAASMYLKLPHLSSKVVYLFYNLA